ncbi:uncharacterized protein LOC126063862 [Elephas maximus indicus]|uniref:uncharacterized protein LOC126063862 n=1 Tax=Elephas maximus indicus TaxID=99487 RepID=UPI002116CE8B|nr:uncharacterized protein LOC126063862 [Elephas maximus indicus]XP_049718283.1 uncharacterized protein LOC126063862 [Elephas maximus indicus]
MPASPGGGTTADTGTSGDSLSPSVGTLQQLTEWTAGPRQGIWSQQGGNPLQLSKIRDSQGHRRELTSLAQTLQATEQVVADYSLWVRKQREHLEALSWELDCVKDLAWTKRAVGAQGMQGSGTWAGCVPAPCGVPTCPGALPKAQWALVASWNSSHSLDIVVPALEQHQQLVQSHRGHGWKPWGKSQRTMAWPQGGRRHIPLVTHSYQLQQIQATVTPSETQAQKTWHHARGP